MKSKLKTSFVLLALMLMMTGNVSNTSSVTLFKLTVKITLIHSDDSHDTGDNTNEFFVAIQIGSSSYTFSSEHDMHTSTTLTLSETLYSNKIIDSGSQVHFQLREYDGPTYNVITQKYVTIFSTGTNSYTSTEISPGSCSTTLSFQVTNY